MSPPLILIEPAFADEPDEYYPKYNRVKFDMLVGHLQDDHEPVEDASKRITASINGPISPTNPVLDENIKSGIFTTWATVLSIAYQIPYGHPWQDKLAALVKAIKALPPPSRPDLEGRFDDDPACADLWGNTTLLATDIRVDWTWRGLATDCPGVGERYSRDEWTNFCAFVARLSTLSIIDLEQNAQQLFTFVFEKPRPSDVIDDNIAAAAMWIVYAGRDLYSRSVKKTYTLVPGKWRVWKQRFEDLSYDQNVHPTSREWASAAWEKMIEIQSLSED